MTMTEGSLAGPDIPGPDAVALRAAADVELLRLVRAGYDTAFAELFSRHAGAVRGFAVRCCTEAADADDLAAEAFFRVLQAVRRGAGPDDNVRAYLLTVVRRLAVEWSVRRKDVPVTDDELSRQLDAVYTAPASRADQQLIAAAFATLPQRWRSVLWRVEVEGERPAVVARYFGLSANATAALARRARQGLRAAYLQAHLAPTGGATGCRSVVDKLGGFTAGQVTGAEARRIRVHLAGCESCAELQAELDDVCVGLRRYAGSLTGPAIGLALGPHTVGHHALLGKVATVALKVGGKVVATGARFKLVVAAMSMAAVGGLGIASGPLIAHFNPVGMNADRGDGLNQVLLHEVPNTSGHPQLLRSSASPFDPTMRSELRGPKPPPHATTGSPSSGVPGGVQAAGQPAGGATTTGAGAGTSNPTGTTAPTKSVQMQQQVLSTTPTTTNPVQLTSTPAPGRGGSPGVTSVPASKVTVWSTSWTSDGTTVYETVWSWSQTIN
ncbi:MAG TPA: sigma-70 family RNA polymerase sigma factor [Pseudonocardiaceae bacterium]|nr:sigma-70 family RNA polymerase sigma factor [Pseudonocardiaceae bacterium]